MRLVTPAFWQKQTAVCHLLAPVATLYQWGQQADRWRKSKHIYAAKVPVISIGNLTVGGTGKTPLTAYLAYMLSRQGEKVAIVSRGFGSHKHASKLPRQVSQTDTAATVGDEPKMLFEDLFDHGVSVWVCPRKHKAVQAAEQAGATVILLDDGLQSWHIYRDMDICVIDGLRGFGNGLTLPAGPLREPLTALTRVHYAVVMGGNAPAALARSHVPHSVAHVRAHKPDLLPLNNRNIIAFCGIGNPNKFFAMLEDAGLHLIDKRRFGDHHFFTPHELETLKNDAFNAKAKLVTTNKDFQRLPPEFRAKCHTVRPVFNHNELEGCMAALTKALKQSRSSRTNRRRARGKQPNLATPATTHTLPARNHPVVAAITATLAKTTALLHKKDRS